ncbi:MAG: glycosyltransferase family A protein [Actinomycetota bacterium]
MARLSAIVPAADGPPTLPECLRALAEAQEGPDETIVVSEPAGAGPAQARNEGARRASGDLLAFVDADVLVHRDALARLRAAFDSDPDLAAVFGSYDDAPRDPGVVSGFRNLLHHHVHQSSPGPAATFWSGLGAIRRDAFEALGGFDEVRHPRYIEDIELGMRLAATGRRCVLDPRIQGTHLKAWTVRSMVATDFAGRGVPWVALLLRTRAGGRERVALNLAPRHRASAAVALTAAAAIATRRPALALGALGALVALNRDLYALLARRRGPAEAVAGVGLHALHHLVGVAAVPAGAIAYLREQRRSGAQTG